MKQEQFRDLVSAASKNLGDFQPSFLAFVEEQTGWVPKKLWEGVMSDELLENFSKDLSKDDVREEIIDLVAEYQTIIESNKGDPLKSLHDLKYGQGNFDIVTSDGGFEFDSDAVDSVKNLLKKSSQYGGDAIDESVLSAIDGVYKGKASSEPATVVEKSQGGTEGRGKMRQAKDGKWYTGNEFDDTIMSAESSNGTDPTMNEGSYLGIYQFGIAAGKDFGLITEEGDFRKDPQKAYEGYLKLKAKANEALKKRGLPLTERDVYLFLQQGASRALTLIDKVNSGDNSNLMGEEYKAAILGNLTSDREKYYNKKGSISATEFFNEIDKFIQNKKQEMKVSKYSPYKDSNTSLDGEGNLNWVMGDENSPQRPDVSSTNLGDGTVTPSTTLTGGAGDSFGAQGLGGDNSFPDFTAETVSGVPSGDVVSEGVINEDSTVESLTDEMVTNFKLAEVSAPSEKEKEISIAKIFGGDEVNSFESSEKFSSALKGLLKGVV